MARVHHDGPWGYEACAAIPQNLIVVLIAPKWGPQYLISCTSTQATTNIYNSQEDACTNCCYTARCHYHVPLLNAFVSATAFVDDGFHESNYFYSA